LNAANKSSRLNQGKKEAAGAPTPAAKLNNFNTWWSSIHEPIDADNCCSPLHENTNASPVFWDFDLREVGLFKKRIKFLKIP